MQDPTKLPKINSEYVSTKEFVQIFASTIKALKKNDETIYDHFKKLSKAVEMLQSAPKQKAPDFSSMTADLKKIIEEKFNSLQAMKGEPGTPGKDGKTPTREFLTDLILALMPTPKHGKDGSPDNAEAIRNKLESLEDDDRLSYKAISGFEEYWKPMIDEYIGILWQRTQFLINSASNNSNNGGNTGTPVDNEVVSGSSTSWMLGGAPLAGSVHLYGGGSRLTPGDDYTIIGQAITTTNAYSAGQVLADYRM